jgi:hypothetical protein
MSIRTLIRHWNPLRPLGVVPSDQFKANADCSAACRGPERRLRQAPGRRRVRVFVCPLQRVRASIQDTVLEAAQAQERSVLFESLSQCLLACVHSSYEQVPFVVVGNARPFKE